MENLIGLGIIVAILAIAIYQQWKKEAYKAKINKIRKNDR